MNTLTDPTTPEFLLMIVALIVLVVAILWTRLAPRHLRSRMEHSSLVKRAWLMMDSEDDKIAFTHLMIEAIKSSGKVTANEADTLYEEMTQDIKVKASHLSEEDMWNVLVGFDRERKDDIYGAIEEILKADGFMSAEEHIWFAGVIKKLN